MGTQLDNSKSWASTALAFAIYQMLAILLFGMPVLSDFSHTYIGQPGAPDPGTHMWFLAWWPYAISHHLNPLITKIVWAPSGYNLTWTTSIPFPALIAAPITQLWGPVVAYNALCLVAPALAAWCAFILCRHLCNSFLPSIFGGYMFGFSPYMLAHLMGHLCLILVFPVPLAVYLILLGMEKRLSRPVFVVLLTILALILFLCSQEVFAMTVTFGACVIAAALLLMRPPLRADLSEVCTLTGIALAFVTIFLTPYLFYAFFHGYPHGMFYPADLYSSDLLAFLIPSPILLLGRLSAVASLAPRVTGGWAEDTPYIGIPLFLIIIDYSLAKWSTTRAKLIILALALVSLASLGPRLTIADTPTLSMPWAWATQLPLLDKALPCRFMMFAFLDTGLIIALYLTASPHKIRKWILALLATVSLIPNLPNGWWFSTLNTPRFFTDGSLQRYLARGTTTLIIPYGRHGNSMLWQAQNGMYFRMAGGYLGVTPPEFIRWPVIDSLLSGAPSFDFPQQLKMFLAAHGVKTVILVQDQRRIWAASLKPLGMTHSEVEDVTLYQVSPGFGVEYAGTTAQVATRRADLTAFAAMATAANDYWAKGLPLRRLTPWEAARLGLLVLPASSNVPDPNFPQWWRNLWLGAFSNSTIAIGILDQYADLAPLIKRYGPTANQIFFPFPQKLQIPVPPDRQGQLLMEFDRRGLARAALQTATPLARLENPKRNQRLPAMPP